MLTYEQKKIEEVGNTRKNKKVIIKQINSS